jgi:exopolyphosphatase/guanosine-5'-triphosphate,3'-diphosphate pyrophosphatase
MTARSGEPAATPLAGIVPRWEWRTFGERFDAADELLGGLKPQRERSSDEVYFLSLHSDASVKVRDGLMDVKHLLRVDDDGLELWTPVLQTGFPLSGDDIAAVMTSLGVAAGTAAGTSSPTLENFVAELIEPDPALRVVAVHKRRAHYEVDECIVELTELSAEQATTRTMSVESPNPSHVSSVVEGFGLADRRNVCIARGLKTLVGFGARRFAVIDVGTNSVKFHLGERRADGSLHTVVDRADVTRLGEGQDDSGVLAETAIARTVDAIAAMADEARRAGSVDIVAVGTAGLRRAPNRAALVDAVRARAAITVEVISGDDEGRLAYLAATSALPAARGQLVVFDSGGGSTQFSFGHDDHVDERFSLDVGAVRVAERFGLASAVSVDTLGAALAALSSEFSRLDGRPRPDAIVAIGGTATNLAAVQHGLAQYDPDRVHATILDLAELDRQIELYRTRSADERRRITGLQPARADVILAGACIVRTILTKLQHDSMTVSDRGLRHGVVIERLAARRAGGSSPGDLGADSLDSETTDTQL